MFMEEGLDALDILVVDKTVPNEFYLYWNDAINTLSYSSKLLLMFAALEALFREQRKNSKAAYYGKIEEVFGPELKTELYGTKEDQGRSGLRHRLSHGEYWGTKVTTRNYMEEIHRGIIRHFNREVLSKNLLQETVVSPQRHLYGNIEGWRGYVKSVSGRPLDLRNLMDAFDANSNSPEGFQIVAPEHRPEGY